MRVRDNDVLLETPAAADIINSFDQIAVSKTNKGVDVSYLVVGATLGLEGGREESRWKIVSVMFLHADSP